MDNNRTLRLLSGIPVGAFLAIWALDSLIAARHWPIPILGLLDDTAHLITAALFLGVVGWSTEGARIIPWALLGSVLIDLDHLPLYTFAPQFAVGGRPPTHSLITVAVIIVLAGVLRRWRAQLLGLALGVCLHFVRDVGTGYGMPLLFPFSAHGFRVPHATYIVALAVATSIGALRLARLYWPSGSTTTVGST